jgi:hypothetical protein
VRTGIHIPAICLLAALLIAGCGGTPTSGGAVGGSDPVTRMAIAGDWNSIAATNVGCNARTDTCAQAHATKGDACLRLAIEQPQSASSKDSRMRNLLDCAEEGYRKALQKQPSKHRAESDFLPRRPALDLERATQSARRCRQGKEARPREREAADGGTGRTPGGSEQRIGLPLRGIGPRLPCRPAAAGARPLRRSAPSGRNAAPLAATAARVGSGTRAHPRADPAAVA